MMLNEKQVALCANNSTDFSGLSAVILNCTLNAVVTGNEDGIKHCAMTILYALQHLGYTIPPQADCGWIGEAGPGPSYGDDGAGLDNFTQRNTTIMTWNLLHMARMLKASRGLPNHGNDRNAWAAGCRFNYENPEHRACRTTFGKGHLQRAPLSSKRAFGTVN